MATKPLTAKKRIGELLIDAEIITQGQLDHALSVQKQSGGKVVEVLISLGYLDSAKVAEFLAAQPGVPSIDLANYRVPTEVVSIIPREFALKNELFPIDKMGKLLTVGMAFPLDSATIQSLEKLTGLRVKALLCNPDDIRNAIQRYYGAGPAGTDQKTTDANQLESGVRLESMAALVRKIDVLPTLPQTVQQVQEAAKSAVSSAKDVARIVSMDPAISGTLLKLANSAAYGFTHRVDNVYMATSLLGLRDTIMAVTSSAVVTVTEQARNFDHKAFWTQSTVCAIAAKRIGEACGMKKSPALFTAGVLCEIGRFALCVSSPDRYAKIGEGCSDSELHAIEEKEFGIGHPEAGYTLAEHWGLPAELAEPIRFHLSPEHAQSCPEITAVVALAARCADANSRGLDTGPGVLAGLDLAMQRINVAPDAILSIYQSLGDAQS